MTAATPLDPQPVDLEGLKARIGPTTLRTASMWRSEFDAMVAEIERLRLEVDQLRTERDELQHRHDSWRAIAITHKRREDAAIARAEAAEAALDRVRALRDRWKREADEAPFTQCYLAGIATELHSAIVHEPAAGPGVGVGKTPAKPAREAPGHYDGDGCTFPSPGHLVTASVPTPEPADPAGGFMEPEAVPELVLDLGAAVPINEPTGDPKA